MGAPLPVRAVIITYNTHLFLGTALLSLQYQDELRMSGIIRRIAASGADVVGLCEVWADSIKQSIIAALRREYPYSYYQPNDSGTALGSGLLLLSKHLLVNTAYTRYTDLVGWDAMAAKGFYTAIANMPTPTGRVTMFLVLTHTQAGSTPAEVAARRNNLRQLASGIRGLPYGDNTLVVMGDLNVCAEVGARETSEYIQLKRTLAPYGLEDLCRLLYPSIGADPDYTYDWFTNKLAKHFDPANQVAQRLDYFFVKAFGTDPVGNSAFATPTDWSYVDPSMGTNDLSDHYPIIATANARSG